MKSRFFLYEAIDLFKPRRLKYARLSESPKYGGKKPKNMKPGFSGFSRNFTHLKEISILGFFPFYVIFVILDDFLTILSDFKKS